MAVPKKRTSTQRKGKRRAGQKKLQLPNLNFCSNCGNLKKPHKICLNCGYYKGKKTSFNTKQTNEKKKRSKT